MLVRSLWFPGFPLLRVSKSFWPTRVIMFRSKLILYEICLNVRLGMHSDSFEKYTPCFLIDSARRSDSSSVQGFFLALIGLPVLMTLLALSRS